MLKKLKEAFTVLNFFSFLEFLGIAGFIVVLIYCIVHSEQIVASGDILKNPLTTMMAISLAVGVICFLISNWLEDMEEAT